MIWPPPMPDTRRVPAPPQMTGFARLAWGMAVAVAFWWVIADRAAVDLWRLVRRRSR